MRADSWPAICCATSSLPPFCRYVVMPVARKLWQLIFVAMPAARLGAESSCGRWPGVGECGR